MRPPCEIMSNQLLPALRALISYHLSKEYGFTQNRIADVLGVTQASVSRGLKQLDRFEKYFTPAVKEAAKEFAEELRKGNQSLEERIKKICIFCQNQKIGGLLCRLHRTENPELQTCEICIREAAPDPRSNVLKNLIRGMNVLSRSTKFARLIPQVQSQLVMSLPNARNLDDVAGFPSRIGVLKNHAHSFMKPEFGASEHLSKILLLVQRHYPTKHAAIVIKYFRNLEMSLGHLNLRFIEVIRKEIDDRADTDQALLAVINEALKIKEPVDVLIDKGFFGIEPVAYVFTDDAETAAKIVIKISNLIEG